MLYLEYDWTFDVYKPRIGQQFTDIVGARSFDTLKDAARHLDSVGLKLGKKTDTRTWAIVAQR